MTPKTSLAPAERLVAFPASLAPEARLAARLMQTLGVSQTPPSRGSGAQSHSPENDIDDFVDALQDPPDEFFETQQIPIPPDPTGFSFSHVPPASVTKGSRCWPGICDSQSQQDQTAHPRPKLADV